VPVITTPELRAVFVSALVLAQSFCQQLVSFDTAPIKCKIQQADGRVAMIEKHVAAAISSYGVHMFGLVPPMRGKGRGQCYDSNDFLNLIFWPMVKAINDGTSKLLPAVHKITAAAAAGARNSSSSSREVAAAAAAAGEAAQPPATVAGAAAATPRATPPSLWSRLATCLGFSAGLESASLETMALRLAQDDLLLPAQAGPLPHYRQQRLVLLVDGAPQHTSAPTAAAIREAGEHGAHPDGLSSNQSHNHTNLKTTASQCCTWYGYRFIALGKTVSSYASVVYCKVTNKLTTLYMTHRNSGVEALTCRGMGGEEND
jgi:hypothetical protein